MSTEIKHFDLHVTGMGSLARIRDVKAQKAKPYTAVSLCAISGDAGDKENLNKVWFDCTIPGAEALRVVCELLRPAIEADKHVTIGFKLGDPRPELFTYKKGPKAGQQGVSLKARLLFIAWAKVDGVDVYKAPANEYHPEDADDRPETVVAEQRVTLAEPEVGASGTGEHADAWGGEEIDDRPQPQADNLPVVVKLERSAPDFEARKADLKARGYRWDGDQKVWKLPKAA